MRGCIFCLRKLMKLSQSWSLKKFYVRVESRSDRASVSESGRKPNERKVRTHMNDDDLILQ
jgi:hypothetical protein